MAPKTVLFNPDQTHKSELSKPDETYQVRELSYPDQTYISDNGTKYQLTSIILIMKVRIKSLQGQLGQSAGVARTYKLQERFQLGLQLVKSLSSMQ